MGTCDPALFPVVLDSFDALATFRRNLTFSKCRLRLLLFRRFLAVGHNGGWWIIFEMLFRAIKRQFYIGVKGKSVKYDSMEKSYLRMTLRMSVLHLIALYATFHDFQNHSRIRKLIGSVGFLSHGVLPITGFKSCYPTCTFQIHLLLA